MSAPHTSNERPFWKQDRKLNERPGVYSDKYRNENYHNYLKERPGQMNAPFEWASLFTAEKFNERPTLNERPPQNKKGVHIRKFAMSAEALIQIFCKNDETRVVFSQKFFVFYNKEIYKHIL